MRQKRAALLPYLGDPYLLNYWLKIAETWNHEVDQILIVMNTSINSDVIGYNFDIVHESPLNIDLYHLPNQVDHGVAIDIGLERLSTGGFDLVMLIEEDAFIFKPGIVDECFSKIESGEYDIVGSKRGSCSQEILNAARDLWGLDYKGLGDQGPNFWPNFFFARIDDLLKTDRNFCARAWQRGEKIEALNDYVVQEEQCVGDTFVNTSLQLRHMGLKPYYVNQYHASPNDLDHFRDRQFLFDEVAPWTHIGSLSSGITGLLQDDFGRPLSRMTIDPPQTDPIFPNYCHTPEERLEFERRVQMWLTFFENAEEGDVSDEFYDLYKRAIYRIIDKYKLSLSNIKARQAAYSKLGL